MLSRYTITADIRFLNMKTKKQTNNKQIKRSISAVEIAIMQFMYQ